MQIKHYLLRKTIKWLRTQNWLEDNSRKKKDKKKGFFWAWKCTDIASSIKNPYKEPFVQLRPWSNDQTLPFLVENYYSQPFFGTF